MPADSARSEPGACTIRTLCAADLDLVGALQEEAIRVLGAGTYSPEQLEAWARFGWHDRHQLLRDPGGFLVAALGDRVIGVGGWSPDSLATEGAWLRYMFVHPDWAGRGIGRTLADSAEASARARGKRRVQVWSSLNAAGFYEALGYRSIRRGRWPVTSQIEIDYVLMVKELERR